MIQQDNISRKRTVSHSLRRCFGAGDCSELADTLLLPTIVMLVGIGSFFFGRFSALEACSGHIIIHPPNNAEIIANPTSATPDFLGEQNATDTQEEIQQKDVPHNFVASKNGSKYYLPTCASANRISVANRVYFGTKKDAESAGYTPASNCKGL